MASSLHLDPQDLKTLALKYFGVTVTQNGSDFNLELPNKIIVSLKSLNFTGTVKHEGLTADVLSLEVSENGVDVKFSLKSDAT